MFLHIGGDNYVLKEDIIAILDKNVVENSKEASMFIENMIRNGLLKNEKMDDVKTYIITCKKDRNNKLKKQHYLYMSNISSSTLLRRNNSRK